MTIQSHRAARRPGVVAAYGRFLALACCIGVMGLASPAIAAPFDEAQTKEIQNLVRDTLLKNPEIIKEAIEELHRREEAKANESRKVELGKLYTAPSPYSTGQGDVTVVEFFDYNCGYCRKAFGEILKLLDSDKQVRVVFVEFPILSEESRMASRATIAAARQGKYFDLHKALISGSGRLSEEKILKAATSLGLNMDQLKKDMESPETDAVIEANLQLGTAMNVQGTPAFFVGDQAVPGAPENLRDVLAKYIKDVRANGCSACGSQNKKS